MNFPEKLLYVGLDKNAPQDNLLLAQTLMDASADSGAADHFGFKVNLDHALIWGEEYIKRLVASGKPVFVDLKMNNGSRTMTNIIRWLGELGVAHTNIWAQSESNFGKTMCAVSGIADRPVVLGVTFYTRWSEEYAQTHHRMSMGELVRHWALVAIDNGADGIILPGNFLEAVRDLQTIKLNPAVRMPGQTTQSAQQHVSGPYEAIMAGSDILVVGSPVYDAPDPPTALLTFLAEMRKAEKDLPQRRG